MLKLTACCVLFITAVTAVQVTFHGSGLSANETRHVWLMGGCENDDFVEIANTTVKDGKWTIDAELKPCVLLWKWRLGSTSWELIKFGNRKTSIYDVQRRTVVYSTFDKNDARLYQDQDVQFVMENPPQSDKSYQVCGKCSGSSVRPGFDQWACSEGAFPSGNKVIVNRQLTTGCLFYWKWGSGPDAKNYELQHEKERITSFGMMARCKELYIPVVQAWWDKKSAREILCESRLPNSTTISTTTIAATSMSFGLQNTSTTTKTSSSKNVVTKALKTEPEYTRTTISKQSGIFSTDSPKKGDLIG